MGIGSTWLRRLGSAAPDAPRLICFPHAGGAAGVFAALARVLAPEVEVLAVQYPGRQDRRREPVRGLGESAEAVAGELRPRPGRRYALFGHSMGALVAYETARLIEHRRQPAPERLFVSGRGAPSLGPGRADRIRDDTELLATLSRLGGTSSAVFEDPELLELIVPPVRADYRALSAYTWAAAPRLSSPLTALVGDADPVVTVEEAEAWRGLTDGGTDLRVFPGGHFYLDRQAEEVAKVVRTSLRSA